MFCHRRKDHKNPESDLDEALGLEEGKPPAGGQKDKTAGPVEG